MKSQNLPKRKLTQLKKQLQKQGRQKKELYNFVLMQALF